METIGKYALSPVATITYEAGKDDWDSITVAEEQLAMGGSVLYVYCFDEQIVTISATNME